MDDGIKQSIDVRRGALCDHYDLPPGARAKAEELFGRMEELGLAILVKASEAANASNADEAIALTTRLLEIDPTNAQAQLLRMQTINNQKNYAQVIEFGEAAAEAQTDEAQKSEVYFMLGKAYENQSNTGKAIEAFRKVTAGDFAAQARSLITELNK